MLDLRDSATSEPLSISHDDQQKVEIVVIADDGTRKPLHLPAGQHRADTDQGLTALLGEARQIHVAVAQLGLA